MANLGYFQLKANPGVWDLGIRPGRSQEVFEMETAGSQGFRSPSSAASVVDTELVLTSFEGKTLYPRFRRRPGMERVDVLDPDAADAAKTSDSFFNSVFKE